MQAGLDGGDWGGESVSADGDSSVGSLLWILLLSLLWAGALGVGAMEDRGGGAALGMFFIGAALSAM